MYSFLLFCIFLEKYDRIISFVTKRVVKNQEQHKRKCYAYL